MPPRLLRPAEGHSAWVSGRPRSCPADRREFRRQATAPIAALGSSRPSSSRARRSRRQSRPPRRRRAAAAAGTPPRWRPGAPSPSARSTPRCPGRRDGARPRCGRNGRAACSGAARAARAPAPESVDRRCSALRNRPSRSTSWPPSMRAGEPEGLAVPPSVAGIVSQPPAGGPRNPRAPEAGGRRAGAAAGSPAAARGRRGGSAPRAFPGPSRSPPAAGGRARSCPSRSSLSG